MKPFVQDDLLRDQKEWPQKAAQESSDRISIRRRICRNTGKPYSKYFVFAYRLQGKSCPVNMWQ